LISGLLLLASYPLLVLKTQSQLIGSPLSHLSGNVTLKGLSQVSRKGLPAFAILNLFGGYELPGLLGEDIKQERLNKIVEERPIKRVERKIWWDEWRKNEYI